MNSSTTLPGTVSRDGAHFYLGPDWGWRELWLTADQVLAFCRNEKELSAERVTLLTGGLLNQTWKINCADHDRVLRVGRTERTPEQVEYERRVVRAWATAAPAVVAAENDDIPVADGHTLTLFPFLAGTSGVSISSAVRNRELVPVLAAMHRAALDLDLDQRTEFRSVDDHPRWNGWDRIRTAVVDRFGRGPDIDSSLGTVDRTIESLERQLDDWQRTGRLTARAPVHGDLNPRNLIFDHDQLIGIIDTDDCRVEPLIWEISGLAYTDRAIDPAQVWRDYLSAGGPLDPRDEELLLPFARMGQLSRVSWLIDQEGAATESAQRDLVALAAALTGSPVRD